MERQCCDYDEMWRSIYEDLETSGPSHRHIHRFCRRLLLPLDYESVLDVGCGPGHNISLLCRGKSINRLAGIDVSGEILGIAEQRHENGEFHCLDIEKQHLDDRYDLVFCSLVLEHIVDDEAALRNLYAMTAKYLVLVTVQGDYGRFAKNEKMLGHVRNYRRGELLAKVRQTGFKVIEKIEWGFPFYSPIGRILYNLNPKQGTGKFGFMERFIANSLYLLYFLNSSRRGDIIIVFAEVCNGPENGNEESNGRKWKNKDKSSMNI